MDGWTVGDAQLMTHSESLHSLTRSRLMHNRHKYILLKVTYLSESLILTSGAE